MSKKSFFQKLAKSVQNIKKDYDDVYESPEEEKKVFVEMEEDEELDTYEDEVGELSIDMFQIDNAIVIRTMVAGIKKDDIDITLTRDSITIEGKREPDDYDEVYEVFYDELYWGPFERSISLPEEVDIEMAEAQEHHGLLTIILPLMDKHKRTKLSIK